MTGRIIKGVGGKFEVLTENGVFSCDARGILKRDKSKLLVGDLVNIDENFRIASRFERFSELVRPPIANVDRLVLVVSVKAPAPNFRIMDTVIANSETLGLRLLIVLNKIDLSKDEASKIAEVYKSFDVCSVSSKTGEGIDEIMKKISGDVSVFSGASGVGKSSIINHLLGDYKQEVGEISRKLQRGKNTTRHTELIPISASTLVADSPGYTSAMISLSDPLKLSKCFREFSFAGECKFLNCTHREEPECAVVRAVNGGMISESRYKSYTAIYKDLLNKKNKKY